MNLKRTPRAFVIGVLATVAMSIPMIAGTVAGIAPTPEPVPRAIARLVLGSMPMPAIMLFAVVTHLGYGGLWAAALAGLRRAITIRDGLLLGLVLWLLMQTAILPLLGWGFFGAAITPKIAVATLVPHAIYGALVGWGGLRFLKAQQQ